MTISLVVQLPPPAEEAAEGSAAATRPTPPPPSRCTTASVGKRGRRQPPRSCAQEDAPPPPRRPGFARRRLSAAARMGKAGRPPARRIWALRCGRRSRKGAGERGYVVCFLAACYCISTSRYKYIKPRHFWRSKDDQCGKLTNNLTRLRASLADFLFGQTLKLV